MTGGGVEHLLASLQSPREALVVNAAACLINMGHDFAIRYEFGFLKSILVMLRHNVFCFTSKNLYVVISSCVCRHDITKRGIISSLVEPLKSPSCRVQSKIAETIATYVTGAEGRNEVCIRLWRYSEHVIFSSSLQMRAREGLPPLIELLNSNDNDVRKYASWALLACSGDAPSAAAISKLGWASVIFASFPRLLLSL